MAMSTCEIAVLENHMSSDIDLNKSFEENLQDYINGDLEAWYLFEEWDREFLANHLNDIVKSDHTLRAEVQRNNGIR